MRGKATMAVTYKKLFKLLVDRDLNKQDLFEKAKNSPATISKWHPVKM